MSTRFNFLTQWFARRAAHLDANVERLFHILSIGTLSKRRTF